MLVCQHDASPHHQKLRHNIPKQGKEGSPEVPANMYSRPNATQFVLLLLLPLPATLEN
jgi:hypothetical protein